MRALCGRAEQRTVRSRPDQRVALPTSALAGSDSRMLLVNEKRFKHALPTARRVPELPQQQSRVVEVTEHGEVPLERIPARLPLDMITLLPAKRSRPMGTEYLSVHRRKRRDLPPATITVEFGVQRRPAVVATAVQPLQLRHHDVRPLPLALPAGGAPVLTASSLRDAAAAAVAAAPRITHSAIALRSAMGIKTTHDEIHDREVVHEAMRLVVVLPPYALATVCHRTVDHLLRTPAADVVRHVLRRTKRRWVASTIQGAYNSWVRLLRWMDRHDIQHDGRFDGITLGDFYESADREARARCAARPLPPNGAVTKRQTGESAAQGLQQRHKHLALRWGVDLPVAAASACYDTRRAPPTPAEAPSIRSLHTIESTLVCGAASTMEPLSPPVLNAAGAILFTAYSANRTEQAQNLVLDGEAHGCVGGVVRRDKHSKPEMRGPRPFWCVAQGLTGDSEWLRIFTATLDGAEESCCLYLENDSPDGDPWKATRLFSAPMAKARIVVAKRAVYRRMAGLTAAEAQMFGLHNERHFIPEIAEGRHETPERAVEIGRWSGSVAQDRDMVPAARARWAHCVRAGRLPARYAPHAKAARVCSIMCEQLLAARRLIARVGVEALPLRGGWHLLERRRGDD